MGWVREEQGHPSRLGQPKRVNDDDDDDDGITSRYHQRRIDIPGVLFSFSLEEGETK